MDYALFLYQVHDPLIYLVSPTLPSVIGLGPTPPRTYSPIKEFKDFSQKD